MLDHALAYAAERGWAVFPLHDVVSGVCSCGEACKSPGKHPRTRTGLNAATRNPDVIRHWWMQTPQANVGVRTGRESGIVVIDLDVHKPGVAEALEQWVGGAFGKPLTVQTGSGGLHLYYRYPDLPETVTIASRKALEGIEGIDVRADGGYVVAPPSRLLKGSYAFV
jgi:putative DNA primase/helicase